MWQIGQELQEASVQLIWLDVILAERRVKNAAQMFDGMSDGMFDGMFGEVFGEVFGGMFGGVFDEMFDRMFDRMSGSGAGIGHAAHRGTQIMERAGVMTTILPGND